MMTQAFNLEEYIVHHVANSNVWHLPFLPPVKLPDFLTVHGLMLLIGFCLLIIFVVVPLFSNRPIPSKLVNLLEIFVIFIRDHIAVSCLGREDGRRMTPLFCTFFVFILCLNLMGLVPFFSTATANINVTGALALITFCFMIFGSIYKNGFHGFFRALIPSGVPWPVVIILFPIEIFGLLIKSFALMIRLFANMMAGHIVIFSLLGLVVLLGLAAMPMILLALFIYLLEILVSFLQAYIFTLLSAMFIGQLYHPAH